MRVGPSAPHRRAQTSDLENCPGSTMGQSPQQQAGVHTVTRRFNRRLTASSTECFCAQKELAFFLWSRSQLWDAARQNKNELFWGFFSDAWFI